MPASRVLQGVANNALSAYVSRYSSYRGYWLFGFLVSEVTALEFDLRAPLPAARDPVSVAHARAIVVLRDQLMKAGVDIDRVHRAIMLLRRGPVVTVTVGDDATRGWVLSAGLAVETYSGRTFRAERLLHVAPHDSRTERRSATTPS